ALDAHSPGCAIGIWSGVSADQTRRRPALAAEAQFFCRDGDDDPLCSHGDTLLEPREVSWRDHALGARQDHIPHQFRGNTCGPLPCPFENILGHPAAPLSTSIPYRRVIAGSAVFRLVGLWSDARLLRSLS